MCLGLHHQWALKPEEVRVNQLIQWLPDDLIAQMTRLLDSGWDAIGYWCDEPLGRRQGYVLAGRNTVHQARVREALERVHRDGGMPAMRYHVSSSHNRLSVEDEVCRVSRDGTTVIACDFTGLASLCVQLGMSTRAALIREERDRCAEIIERLLQFRDASRSTR